MICCSNFLLRVGALALVTVLSTACGGGGASNTTPVAPVTPVLPITSALSNVLDIRVDAGPADSGYNVNRLYVDVRICQAGSSQCQTIDHVLLDSGSTGLRLLSSVIPLSLKLDRKTASTGFPLLNCAQFVDNTFAWGPVALADVVLGGKTAANVPIQLIADPAAGNPPVACSGGGTAMSSIADLGAKGVLGLGLFKEDCGRGCETTLHNGFYYTCASATCSSTSGVKVPLAEQLKNPAALFASDNNGMVIELPAVASSGATSLSGSLIFGVDTRDNNRPTSGLVLTTNASGYFSTMLAGKTMAESFLDTGSNGLYFDSAVFPVCAGSSRGFYCPASINNLTATLTGANRVSTPVSFSIDNAAAMFADASKVVLPSLSGPFGTSAGFDWGLPFFYGRRVLIGFEGRASSLATGPYYAF